MANSSASTSSAPKPRGTSAQTACSTCRTVFEVSSELLKSTDTRVRCGECYAIFDAASNLVEGQPATGGDGTQGARAVPVEDKPEADASGGHDGGLDVTYSDFDLFSEDADLPEIAYFDQTRDTPEFDFDTVALEEDETFNDTLFAHDATVDAGSLPSAAGMVLPKTAIVGKIVDKTSPSEPLVFNYRDPDPAVAVDVGTVIPESVTPPSITTSGTASGATSTSVASDSTVQSDAAGTALEPDGFDDTLIVGSDPPEAPDSHTSSEDSARRSRWLIPALVLALVTLVCALYAWRQRDSLYNDPLTRPVYTLFCQVTGCTVPSRVSVEDLRLTQRNVYSHPEFNDALVIDVSFQNTAEFAQRYPMLLVRLSDPSGRMVARRAFLPGEYLPDWQQQDTLAAGAQRDISLDVSDPGENASSFEVDFVAAPWDTP